MTLITKAKQLTKAFDGVIADISVENLPIHVGNADAVAENVATDHDVVVGSRRRSPAHYDGVGQRTNVQRRWFSRHSRLFKNTSSPSSSSRPVSHLSRPLSPTQPSILLGSVITRHPCSDSSHVNAPYKSSFYYYYYYYIEF